MATVTPRPGKYESLVHGEDDIVRTCLKVLASGYRPEVSASSMPAPMALVMQHCGTAGLAVWQ